MRDNKSLIFIILSISLPFLIVAWTGVRIYYINKHNTRLADENFQKLKQTITTSYLAKGSFSSDYFSRKVRENVSHNVRLRALVIYSSPGIHYLYAVNSSYISDHSENGITGAKPPTISVNPIRETKLTSKLTFSNRDDIYVLSVYNIVTTHDLFQVFRDAAIAFLGLIVLIVIFMIVPVPGKRRHPVKPSPAREKSKSQPDNEENSFQGTAEFQNAEIRAETPSPVHSSESIQNVEPSQSADSQGLFSPHSGLGWESYLENRLNFELRRAASFDQDLTLVLFSSSELKKTDPYYRVIAKGIIDFFTFQDLTFEYGENGFSVILPNTDLDQSIKKVELFLTKLKTAAPEVASLTSVGLSSRNGRLLSAERIINEAAKALQKAREVRGTKIFGFRSDPVKYRKYIASQFG